MRVLDVLAKGPERLRTRWRSWLWQSLLQAPRIELQAHPQIMGQRHIRIGPDFRAGRMLWLQAVTSYRDQVFTPRLVIGARVSCSDGVHIACVQQLTIGDDVLVGSKVHITDHNHGRYRGEAGPSSPDEPPATRALAGAPVHIGDRVFLADGVVVLPGSRIGAGTIVGANSVVMGDLPADAVCVGSPARPVRRFDRASMTWVPVAPAECDPTPASNDLGRAK